MSNFKANKSQIALMVAIVAATLSNSESPFVYVSEKDAKPLIAAGLVEQNPDFKNEANELATRATAAGIEAYPLPVAGSENVTGDNTAPAGNAPLATTTKPAFAIATVEMPGKRATGRAGTEAYPFEQLEVGASFFVPATEKRKDPAKALGSTVTSANDRYSEEVPGETRTNRKGNIVPVKKALRTFAVRHVADGAAWGHPGVQGAGIWRTL